MIHEIDDALRDWVQTVVPDVPVSLGAPSTTPGERGVNLYLLELTSHPPARGTTRPPLQLILRYLVTTRADKPEEAHRMLGDIVFAAMERDDLEVALEPLPGAAWSAFGTPPGPSFILQMPLRKLVAQPAAKFVRGPLLVQASSIATLYGRVVGPNDIPLSEALVELPSLQLAQRTDARGYFRFAGVPSDPRSAQLRVSAKGRQFSVAVDRPESSSEPVVIHLEPLGE